MAQDAGQQEPPSLDEFSKRLESARRARLDAENLNAPQSVAMGQGFRLASELLAAMIVGPLLGLVIDRVTGFGPWGLLAGIFLGFAAGLRNVGVAMKAPQQSDEQATVDAEPGIDGQKQD